MKPYWKRRVKQKSAYVREYAYHEDGSNAVDENGDIMYRDRPNRAMRREYHAKIRKDLKGVKLD